jgi:hypothetical protein
MLDLTRKFGMTLTLASQSLAQGRDIRAALQTCLQIAFRLGHDDANSAAPRFTQTVVPPEDPPFLQDLVLSLLGVGQHPAEPDLKRTQASYWETRLKHLPKGHALVHIANQTVEVETLIAPPIADQRDLNRIKEEDILQAVLTYQYLSVPQLTRLFFSPHSKHSANHAGEYLKGLTEAGYLHRFPLPKTQRGTPAFIYTLSGKGRKHLASLGCDLPATVRDAKPAPSYQHIQHTLSVNDVLIAASLLPRSNAAISLECMRHEWMLKQRPLHARPAAESGAGKNAGASTVIPDGYLDFRLRLPEATYQTAVWLELDRGTEEQKQFHMKVRGLYAAATTDSYLREYAGEAGYLTIAFATTAGD